MKSLCKKQKNRRSRFENIFENIEIEYIAVNKKEADQHICAVVRALIEIDQILSREETDKVYKEAS